MYILMKRDMSAKLFLLCHICGFMCNYKSINNRRSRRSKVYYSGSIAERSRASIHPLCSPFSLSVHAFFYYYNVCTHSFWTKFCLSSLFLPSHLHCYSPSLHQNTSPKWLTPSFLKMHSWRHPGRAKMLWML